MEYTDEDLEKLLEKEKTPFTLYFKVFFLITIVSIGAVFIHIYAQREPIETDETGSKTLESVLGVKEEIFGTETVLGLKDEVEKDGVLSALNTVKKEVQTEAAKTASQTVDKTADSTVNYLYDKTILQVIEKMIQSLPERQKAQFLDKMCRQ